MSDFLPVDEEGAPTVLVRRAKAVRGDVPFRMVCEPRFDYARAGMSIEITGEGATFVSNGPDRTARRLHSTVPLRWEGEGVTVEFTLRPDESASFVLEEMLPGHEARCAALRSI